MRKHIYALALFMLAGGMTAAGLMGGISSGNAKASKSDNVLSVNDIQADPAAYKGVITITGVVAARDTTDPKVFAMIETAEAKICKITGCASFYLPVRYEGKIPQEWDEVNVTGAFTEGGALLFKAAKVELIRHISFKEEK